MRAFSERVRHSIRVNFISGLLVAIPFALTLACLGWVWQQIDGPLTSVFHFVAGPETNERPWSKLVHGLIHTRFGEVVVPLLGLLLLLLLVLFIGVLIRSIFGKLLLGRVEAAVNRLPVIGMLYGAIKQLGEAFISADGKSKFQRAVAVQFPSPGTWAIAFVTGPGENLLRHVPKEKDALRSTPMLTVFVPTSPLPTQGFMLVVPVSETIELEMSVPDALKLVVSGGMLAPGGMKKDGTAKPLAIAERR